LLSNQPAAELAGRLGVTGLTDVTGFGLAGHLLEMLEAADLSAELFLDRIALLPGTETLLQAGVESTLAPGNRAAEAAIAVEQRLRNLPAYQVLFDPQTSGGLLMGVAPEHADGLLARLAEQSDVPAAVVGRVLPRGDGTSATERIRCRQHGT